MKIFKKVILTGLAMICMLLMSIAPAVAFQCTSSGCSGITNGSVDFKCSKNVVINCNSNGQTYAATSDHSSGDRVYGVSSDASVVYYTTKAKGSHWDSSSFSASDSSAFSGWHSL